mmetsp:Transcript_6793/g.11944  ORF Transcript_6793/g.11944 Transcript_6793/m.11944 type:complete len:242 (-) Transcript_6793:3-728(-)
MRDREDRVKWASGWTMKDNMLAPNYVAQSYMFKHEPFLGNSFINLCIQDARLLRRSCSVPGLMKAPHIFAGNDTCPVRPDSLDQACQPSPEATSQAVKGASEARTNAQKCEKGNPDLRGTPQDFTTVIIRNLPVHCDQVGVQCALLKAGLGGTYDYLYVPLRFHDGSCQGYGFINFVTHQLAATFMAQWQGHRAFCTPSHRKPLAVDVASIQGVVALAERSSLRCARNPRFRPLVNREIAT